MIQKIGQNSWPWLVKNLGLDFKKILEEKLGSTIIFIDILQIVEKRLMYIIPRTVFSSR